MNDKRRAMLRRALELLENASNIVDSVCDEEQDCLDNYPENLQGTERFEQMEAAVDTLNDALEQIEGAKSSLESAKG